jgi:hypothetical protein
MPFKPYLLILSIVCAALTACGDKAVETSPEPAQETDTNGDDTNTTSPDTEITPDASESDLNIVAGRSIGAAELGQTFAEIKAVLGEPNTARGYNRMILGTWSALGLEINFSSPLSFEIDDTAIALAMNTVTETGFSGDVIPGMEKSQVENVLGISTDETLGFSFYAEGIVVEYDENNVASKVGIYAPYVVRTEPPEMLPAATTMDAPQ